MKMKIDLENGCQHKGERTFRGVQEDAKGNPTLTLWNCQVCKSTFAEPIPSLEKTWKAIQDLTERIERLERADKTNAHFMTSLSEKT